MTNDEWVHAVEETVRDLDALEFSGSSNEAQGALRAVGRGRARAVVLAACRVRRGGEARRPERAAERDRLQWKWRVEDLREQLAEAERRLAEHS
jgi:uncharacterized protein YceH (UPF0502 family)